MFKFADIAVPGLRLQFIARGRREDQFRLAVQLCLFTEQDMCQRRDLRFCGLKVAQIEGKLAGVVCGEGSAVGMLSVLGVAVSSAVLVGYGVWARRTGRVPRAPRRALAS